MHTKIPLLSVDNPNIVMIRYTTSPNIPFNNMIAKLFFHGKRLDILIFICDAVRAKSKKHVKKSVTNVAMAGPIKPSR